MLYIEVLDTLTGTVYVIYVHDEQNVGSEAERVVNMLEAAYPGRFIVDICGVWGIAELIEFIQEEDELYNGEEV